MNVTFVPGEQNGYQPRALHEHALLGYAIFLLLVKIIFLFGLTVYPVIVYSSEITQKKILELANDARRDAGREPLVMNERLTRAATKKAQEMLDSEYFAHVSPSGKSPWTWIKNEGYVYRIAGENLGIDFFEVEALHDAWMASSTHRDNILCERFEEIGIGVVQGEYDGLDTVVAVQMFASPLEGVQSDPEVVTPSFEERAILPSMAMVLPTMTPTATPTPVPTPSLVERSLEAPLIVPVITEPYGGSYVSSSTRTVHGVANEGSRIALLIQGEEVVRDIVVGSSGEFSISVPIERLKEGSYEFVVVATNHEERLFSDPLEVIVDTTAPAVFPRAECVERESGELRVQTYRFSVIGAERVVASSEEFPVKLNHEEDELYSVALPDDLSQRATIIVEARDTAGNVTTERIVYDPRELASDRACSHVPRILGLTYGEMESTANSVIGFVGLYVFLVLILNVVVNVRVQHPRLIFHALVFLAFMAIILVV